MRWSRGGFTLLELMLAMAVLAVVVTMLSLALGGILRLTETTEQQEAIAHQVQTALRRINEDLSGAVALKDQLFIGTTHELRRERADTLIFPSQTHLVFNPEKQKTGLALIRYQVQADAEEPWKLKLLRSDTPLLPKEKSEVDASRSTGQSVSEEENEEENEDALAFLLAENLRSVRFRYLDHKGQEFDSWRVSVGEKQEKTEHEGEQEEGPLLPAVVFCTLEVWLDRDKELSQAFTTGMIIPIGLMAQEPDDEKK